jgi:hypothetical protein
MVVPLITEDFIAPHHSQKLYEAWGSHLVQRCPGFKKFLQKGRRRYLLHFSYFGKSLPATIKYQDTLL